jgi:hypothetical protein
MASLSFMGTFPPLFPWDGKPDMPGSATLVLRWDLDYGFTPPPAGLSIEPGTVGTVRGPGEGKSYRARAKPRGESGGRRLLPLRED